MERCKTGTPVFRIAAGVCDARKGGKPTRFRLTGCVIERRWWSAFKCLILFVHRGRIICFNPMSVFCLEPLWHVPVSSSRGPVGGGGQRRVPRQEIPGKESPNRHSKVRLTSSASTPAPVHVLKGASVPQGEAQYSSHSSSNTLSSNASSNHSDERWFDGGERGGGGCVGDSADPDPDPLNKGGSNDSGIDASAPYTNARHGNVPNKTVHCFAGYGGVQELSVGRGSSGGDARRRESSPIVPPAANQNKGYRTRTFPPPGSSAEKMDAFKPR